MDFKNKRKTTPVVSYDSLSILSHMQNKYSVLNHAES